MELIDLVKTLSGYQEEKLLNVVKGVLKHHYSDKDIESTADFLIAKGNIPIALVAHVDTVFSIPASEFFYDAEKAVLWSPQGLGADDRAGVAAILSLVSMGLKPHIILTTKEEKGGIGAQALIRQHPDSPFKELKYIIELDRRGSNDCVFYNCDNPKFTQYVESFGFVTNLGSFTDISILCPVWGVAGVNLSVGYREEHSKSEHLYLTDLTATIRKVEKMLKDASHSKIFKYIPLAYNPYDILAAYYGTGQVYSYGSPEEADFYSMDCEICHNSTDWTEVVDVRTAKKKTKSVCYHCFSKLKNVELCYSCNDWYFSRKNSSNLCEECEEKSRDGKNNTYGNISRATTSI